MTAARREQSFQDVPMAVSALNAQRLRDTGDYEAARKAFIARQPIGRIGQPEEIAALVVYLASDESTYTTGVAHIIDGGWANT